MARARRAKGLLLLFGRFLRGFLRTAAGESQLRDAALVERAEAELFHLFVLGIRGGGEREIELRIFAELERDAAVLGGVVGAEKAGVIAIEHVFAR